MVENLTFMNVIVSEANIFFELIKNNTFTLNGGYFENLTLNLDSNLIKSQKQNEIIIMNISFMELSLNSACLLQIQYSSRLIFSNVYLGFCQLLNSRGFISAFQCIVIIQKFHLFSLASN